MIQSNHFEYIRNRWAHFTKREQVANKIDQIFSKGDLDIDQPQKYTIQESILFKYSKLQIFEQEISKLLFKYLIADHTSKAQYINIIKQLERSKITNFFNQEQKRNLLFELITHVHICEQNIDKEIFTNFLLKLATDISLEPSQIKLLIEYLLSIQSKIKINTIEGAKISINNYLLFRFIQRFLKLNEIEYNYNIVSKRFNEMKQELKKIFYELISKLFERKIKEYLINLIKDCFNMINSIEFTIAVIIFKIIINQFFNFFISTQLDDKEKGLFMPFLGLIFSKILILRSQLPKIQYQLIHKRQQKKIQCSLCQELFGDMAKYTITKKQECVIYLCNGCSLYKFHKKYENQQLCVVTNLIPITIVAFNKISQIKALKHSKWIMISQFIEEILLNKSKKTETIELIKNLENYKIQDLSQNLLKGCLGFIYYLHQNVGMKYHLKMLFAYWILQTNSDSYSRRLRALKEMKNLFTIYESESDEQLDDYKEKNYKILSTRSYDKNEQVRLQAMKNIELIYTLSKDIKYLKLLLSKISDSELKIRKFVINSIRIIDQEIISNHSQIFQQIILRLIEATNDEFLVIRKQAYQCLKSIFFSNRTKHKNIQNRLETLILNPNCRYNRTLMNILVQSCLNQIQNIPFLYEMLQAIIVKILRKKQEIQNGIMFLEILSEHEPKLFEMWNSEIIDMAKNVFLNYQTEAQVNIYVEFCKLINNISQKIKKCTSKEKNTIEEILKRLQQNIFKQNGTIVQASLPIFVKFYLNLDKQDYILQISIKCYKYLLYMTNKQQFSDEEISHIHRSMIIVSIIMIELHKNIKNPMINQKLITYYEILIGFIQKIPRQHKYKSIQSLALYWEYNEKFLYVSEQILQKIFADITDQKIVQLIYHKFHNKILQCITNQENNKILILIQTIFISTYSKFFNSKNQKIRLLIIQILSKLLSIGLVSVFQHIKFIFASLCDPEQQIRNHAKLAIQNLQQKFIYHNFKETILYTINYIKQNYGEVVVQTIDKKFFFDILIQKNAKLSKKLSTKNEKKIKPTFIKRLGEIMTRLDEITKSSVRHIIEFICLCINMTNNFDIIEFRQIMISLQYKIQLNYHKITKQLKILRNEENENTDNEDENNQIIQNGYILYRMLETLNRLTNGKSIEEKNRQLEIKDEEFIHISHYQQHNKELKQIQHLHKNIKIMYLKYDQKITKKEKANKKKKRQEKKQSKSISNYDYQKQNRSQNHSGDHFNQSNNYKLKLRTTKQKRSYLQ